MSHFSVILGGMAPATALGFAAAARRLAAESRRRGLLVPVFRSPPRLPGARSLRWTGDGAVVAVRIRHRLMADVVCDMVDGVVAANRLTAAEAAAHRRDLLEAAVPDLAPADMASSSAA